ncbi:MAG: 3D domain-containing protein [Clostridia bacterium]|nr:3D domain-containing protein [Clostridia bacterium]
MLPLAKNIKRYFSFKEIMIVAIAIVISVSAGVGIFLNFKSDVLINDNEKQIAVKTMKTTVREVLEQNGISVSPDDYISIPMDAKLQKMGKNIITIDRAVPVNIYVDGQQKTLMTYRDTVKEALENSSYKLTESDKLEGVSIDDKISKDLNIKIVRVKKEIVNEDTSIPYKVQSKENSRLDKGLEKTVREGKEGTYRKTFEVVLEDGKEVTKKLISEAVVAAPIDKLIELGTVLTHKTSRGDVVRYKKVLDMKATAYTASFKDTGKSPGDPGFGITYTGVKARKGIIAVDPKVIPLGTKVYVEVAGNTPDYGYAVAADIGGAIKGNLIDLYLDSQSVVDAWGKKKVKVYILQD